MIATIKRLGEKRWRATVEDERSTWNLEWDQQRKQWVLMNGRGARNRDPDLKPLILEAINKEWQKELARLMLEGAEP